MKLIIGGASGFIGTALVRQALAHPEITSIVALGRREVSLPPSTESDGSKAKLKSIVCRDFEAYSESEKAEMVGANACIWTIAIPPSKLKSVTWEEACKISRDYAITAMETMSQLPRGNVTGKFRFLYISGSSAERDPTKKPLLLGDYCLMRGEAETLVLAHARESNGTMEACVAKPGLVEDPENLSMVGKAVGTVGSAIFGFPKINLSELCASLLDQVVNGFEKDTLTNEDLARIGSKLRAAQETA
ncbi:hypothetical protein GGR50DRAFT_691168 [Xylaria sp. CBS 124048]|nr:hypothetical protein GGR50DRAFT_691168 [Xylaria sp. CBS 124048]